MPNDNKKPVKKPNPTVSAPQSSVQRPAPLGTTITCSFGGKGTPAVRSVKNNKGGKK